MHPKMAGMHIATDEKIQKFKCIAWKFIVASYMP